MSVDKKYDAHAQDAKRDGQKAPVAPNQPAENLVR